MMLQLEGDKTLAQDPSVCWANLSDPGFLLECIPNAEQSGSVGQEGSDEIQFKLRPGVSFIRGTLDVTIKVEKVELGGPVKSVRYLIHSRAIGSSSDAEALLKLESVAGGTHVSWTILIKTLGGLLKA